MPSIPADEASFQIPSEPLAETSAGAAVDLVADPLTESAADGVAAKSEASAESATAETLSALAPETQAPASETPAPETTEPQGRTPERRKLKSIKLDRTLAELENAFDSWNSVVPGKKARPQSIVPGQSAPLHPSPEEVTFKQRTKELLSQLREQLFELSDD